MPKNNDYDIFGGGNFFDYIDSGKRGNKDDFFSYIDQGMNFGDYTKPPKGKSRKGRPKISNDPMEFGIGLQSFGDSVMQSEISTGNAIRHGSKARKARKERYEKEKQIKLKEKGLKEGKTIGRVVYEKIKLAHNKRQTRNQLKKYYHPKPKSEKEEKQKEETLQRYRNQEDYK